MYTLSGGMGFKEAVDAIGNALIGLVDPDVFEQLDYPYPDNFYPNPGKPSLTVRWDGISADNNGNDPDLLVPAGMRYEVRIYHTQLAPSPDVDGYPYAQEQIAVGTEQMFEGIARNRNLSGLVLDIIVDGSVSGDLIEPSTEQLFYGHEMLLDVRLHNQ